MAFNYTSYILIGRGMFCLAALFYLFASGVVILGKGYKSRPAIFFICSGLLANGAYALIRYFFSWPLMPMYQTPFFLPLFVGMFSLRHLFSERMEQWDLTPFTISFLSLVALFFPNDFYLPFFKTRTIFSHLFFFTGVMAKAFFIIAGIRAVLFISCPSLGNREQVTSKDSQALDTVFPWVIWGFALLTVSVFCGEMWSYLGWGSPVVWDDPAILTLMATWFYYSALLHLRFHRGWSVNGRIRAVILGSILTMVLNLYPELGSLHIPDTGQLLKVLK